MAINLQQLVSNNITKARSTPSVAYRNPLMGDSYTPESFPLANNPNSSFALGTKLIQDSLTAGERRKSAAMNDLKEQEALDWQRYIDNRNHALEANKFEELVRNNIAGNAIDDRNAAANEKSNALAWDKHNIELANKETLSNARDAFRKESVNAGNVLKNLVEFKDGQIVISPKNMTEIQKVIGMSKSGYLSNPYIQKYINNGGKLDSFNDVRNPATLNLINQVTKAHDLNVTNTAANNFLKQNMQVANQSPTSVQSIMDRNDLEYDPNKHTIKLKTSNPLAGADAEYAIEAAKTFKAKSNENQEEYSDTLGDVTENLSKANRAVWNKLTIKEQEAFASYVMLGTGLVHNNDGFYSGNFSNDAVEDSFEKLLPQVQKWKEQNKQTKILNDNLQKYIAAAKQADSILSAVNMVNKQQ